jgi:hypothetical protein
MAGLRRQYALGDATRDGSVAPNPAVPPKRKVSGEFDEADIRNFVNTMVGLPLEEGRNNHRGPS